MTNKEITQNLKTLIQLRTEFITLTEFMDAEQPNHPIDFEQLVTDVDDKIRELLFIKEFNLKDW